MKKADFKKELKHFYNASSEKVAIVKVPEMSFLMVDGKGDPNTAQEYKDAIEALYAISYALKFMVKKEKEIDYVVLPLEGLWWVDDVTQFSAENKDVWKWTSMIMQPEYVTKDLVKKAVEQIRKKKNLPPLSKLRFQSFDEGLSAQAS